MRKMFEIHISFWNIALKNFRLSCIVSTQDAYYIADTKSMTGVRYNSLTCSLLVTNLYHISNRGRSPVDNDECSEGYVVKMNDCHPNASCVNTQGSRKFSGSQERTLDSEVL